jgi:DNA-binding IclR family transcriptional regulator
MNDEKITVRVTSTGQTLDVVVFSKRAEVITVVLGEGVHNMRCSLTPTRNGMAYAGSAMGREIVYERSQAQVKADIEKLDPRLKDPRRR